MCSASHSIRLASRSALAFASNSCSNSGVTSLSAEIASVLCWRLYSQNTRTFFVPTCVTFPKSWAALLASDLRITFVPTVNISNAPCSMSSITWGRMSLAQSSPTKSLSIRGSCEDTTPSDTPDRQPCALPSLARSGPCDTHDPRPDAPHMSAHVLPRCAVLYQGQALHTHWDHYHGQTLPLHRAPAP